MKAIGRFFQYMGRDILRGIKEWAGTTILCILGTILLIGGVVLITYGLGWIVHTFIQPLEVVTFGSIFTMGAQLFSILMVVGMVIFLIVHTFIPIVKWIISLIKRARHVSSQSIKGQPSLTPQGLTPKPKIKPPAQRVNFFRIVCFDCGGEVSTTTYCIPKPCTVHTPIQVCEKCFKEYLEQIGHHDGDAYPEGVSVTPPTPLTYEFDSALRPERNFRPLGEEVEIKGGIVTRYIDGVQVGEWNPLTMVPAVEGGLERKFVPESKLPEPDGRYKFEIEHHGEWDAGIRPYSDTVVIQVISGDPGGDAGEFEEHMRQALKEWYDGATVETQKEFDLRIKAEDELYRGRGD